MDLLNIIVVAHSFIKVLKFYSPLTSIKENLRKQGNKRLYKIKQRLSYVLLFINGCMYTA